MRKEFIELYFELLQARANPRIKGDYIIYSPIITLDNNDNQVYVDSGVLIQKITNQEHIEGYIFYIINDIKYHLSKPDDIDLGSFEEIIKIMKNKLKEGF